MYEKYITALQLMDAVIATKDIPYPKTGVHPCVSAWDTLFTYIHANFDEPLSSQRNKEITDEIIDADASDTRITLALHTPESIDTLIKSIPPVLIDTVWPVAIARYLLREINLPFRHTDSLTFSEFHTRYANAILGRS